MGFLRKMRNIFHDDWCSKCTAQMDVERKKLYMLPGVRVGHYVSHRDADYYLGHMVLVEKKADIPTGVYACGVTAYRCPKCNHRAVLLQVFLPVRDREMMEEVVLYENGELTDEERLADAVAFLHAAKDEFDLLMPDFLDATGREKIPQYMILAKYTVNGESKSQWIDIGTPGDHIWRCDYDIYEYEHYFDYDVYGIPKHTIEKNALYDLMAEACEDESDEEFLDSHFDWAFHTVCDRVKNEYGKDIEDEEWVLLRIDEESREHGEYDVYVSCGGLVMCIRMQGTNNFYLRSVTDED